MTVTVACVLKSGRFEQAIYKDGYTADDVLRLKNMVADNLGDHRFVCFSDVDVPCEKIPLKNNWPGWWSKVEIFSEIFDGNVLYFDLDTVIAGDLTEFVEYPHKFTMLRDFASWGVPNSGMIAWNGDYRKIYENFANNPQQYMREYIAPPRLGDQSYISEHQPPDMLWQDQFPDKIFSYKFHCREKPKPNDPRVVCFHGQPKGAGSTGWVKDIWSNANGIR